VLEMPWWAVLYFLAFAGVTAAWVRSELLQGPEWEHLIVEVLSEACLVLVAVGYWQASVRSALGPLANWLFIAGCAWLVVAGIKQWQAYEPDPELSRGFNIASVVIGVGLYVLAASPLLYWAFSYAVRGDVAST
jgi:amino acid transporter